MAQKVENVISSKLYAEMAKNSVCVKVSAADNKHTNVFDFANPAKDKVDYFIPEKGTEEIGDKKEKTKNILKTVGLAALGIGVIAGGVFRSRKLSKLTDTEKYIRK